MIAKNFVAYHQSERGEFRRLLKHRFRLDVSTVRALLNDLSDSHDKRQRNTTPPGDDDEHNAANKCTIFPVYTLPPLHRP